ncbi:hypothetical protein Tco_0216449 [Tanacetum coccineum]
MPYPRFTKVIIDHFISKNKTISMRNRINLHTIIDDHLLGTLKYVSKTTTVQKYGALIPANMINQAIKDSKAYKIFLPYTTGKAIPKEARKLKKVASTLEKLTLVLEEEPAKSKRAKKATTAKKTTPTKKSSTTQTAGVKIRDTPNVSVSQKKPSAKVDRGKGIDLLSEIALTEVAQLKEVQKKSMRDFHRIHASGSGKGASLQPKALKVDKTIPTDTNEGTRTYKDDENNDDDANNKKNDDKSDDDRSESNEFVHTPSYYTPTDDEEEFVKDDEEDSITKELYDDLNGNKQQETVYEQVMEDAHITLTTVHVPSSSISSDLASKYFNFDNIPTTYAEIVSPKDITVHHEEPSNQTPSLLAIPFSFISETSYVFTTTIPPQMLMSGPHDTQYCMENPEQAFVEYASTRIDEVRDAKISRFEADFKQHQSKVSNKLDAFLKAFNDQMTGVLPSDTGFAAVLAVLITRTSQSRQHGMSKPASYYLTD